MKANRSKSAPRSDAQALWETYARTRSEAARNRLIEAHLGIVHFHAARLMDRLPREVCEGDLIQWGSVGLMQAVEGFDTSRGNQFGTYAARRICGAMLDGLRYSARQGRGALDAAKWIGNAEDAIYAETGRRATPEEVAERLRRDGRREYKRLKRQRAVTHISLSNVSEDRNGRGVREIDTITDSRGTDPAQLAAVADSFQQVEGLLLGGEFKLSEALVIKGYYLLGMTMIDIGESLRVTESRICQIHSRVMARLRSRLCEAA